eukprot:GGOE01014618.1.p1 GENE.GGOE01014618.1~~GGOE01014618.1.p1  ORF type:complete len:537 (-),score=107.92 GGOE01014618.1:345-1898(-)
MPAGSPSGAKPDDLTLLSVELEMMRYGVNPLFNARRHPGPGQYDPHNEDLSTVNYNLCSVDGSFGKSCRKTFLASSVSPGPMYSPSGPLKKTAGGGFSKASRFPDPKPTPGFHRKLNPNPKPTSLDGTFSRSARNTALFGSDSPGPCYDTSRTFLTWSKNRTMPKAERFPVPETEESPGPIYLPKPIVIGPTTIFSHGERFNPPVDSSPGPSTAALDFDKPAARASPSFSLGAKAPDPRPSGVPGFIYHPKDDRGTGPAFSFAGPDPNQPPGPRQPHSPKHVPTSPSKQSPGAKGGMKDDGVASQLQDEEDDLSELDRNKSNSKPNRGESSPQHASPRKVRSANRAPSPAAGHDTPGPGQYLNIHKLFENRPGGPACTMGRRLRPSDSKVPGPGTYEAPPVIGRKDAPGGKIGTAPRPDLEVGTISPGPVYSNEKWPAKTPIRHGVASQTTNYTAKAEARARAERESREQQLMKRQMRALHSDVLPCDEGYVDYAPATKLDDVASPTKDRFLVNVWY